MDIAKLIFLGLAAGTFSGLIGLGGGVILVPALIFLFGFSQKQAQGTTLALMIPPIGILGALEYYKNGYVDFKVAGLICLGFLFGSLLGAQWAVALPTAAIKKVFAVSIILIGCRILFSR